VPGLCVGLNTDAMLQDLTQYREDPKINVFTSSFEKQAMLSLNQKSVNRILTLVPPYTFVTIFLSSANSGRNIN
jgi:hypothetical protein